MSEYGEVWDSVPVSDYHYYKHSGRISPVPYLLGLFGLLVASIVLHVLATVLGAWLNSWFVEYGLFIFAAAGAGYLAKWTILVTKTRSVMAVRIQAWIVGLVSFYVHCAVHFGVLYAVYYSMYDYGNASLGIYLETFPFALELTIYLFSAPGVLFVECREWILLADDGLWWVLFLAVGCVSSIGFQFAAVKEARKPFSEENGSWMKEEDSNAHLELFEPHEAENAAGALESGNTAFLLSRPRCRPGSFEPFSCVTFLKTKGVNTGYIQITNARYAQGEHGGKPKVSDRIAFVPPIMLGKEKADELEQTLNTPPVRTDGEGQAESARKERILDGPLEIE